MKQLLPIVLAGFFGVAAQAADEPLNTDPFVYMDTDLTDLNQFIWEKRPVIVFADSRNDPNFRRQLEFLQENPGALSDRDVVVLVDTNPTEMSPLRERFRPRGFMLVLVGKEGEVKLRKPFPWTIRELSRAIDRTPLRRRELRNR